MVRAVPNVAWGREGGGRRPSGGLAVRPAGSLGGGRGGPDRRGSASISGPAYPAGRLGALACGTVIFAAATRTPTRPRTSSGSSWTARRPTAPRPRPTGVAVQELLGVPDSPT